MYVKLRSKPINQRNITGLPSLSGNTQKFQEIWIFLHDLHRMKFDSFLRVEPEMPGTLGGALITNKIHGYL